MAEMPIDPNDSEAVERVALKMANVIRRRAGRDEVGSLNHSDIDAAYWRKEAATFIGIYNDAFQADG